MKQEDKDLLLKELSARVPYGLMCACGEYVGQLKLVCPDGDYCILQNSPYTIETIKPYLRPMSSMTEEEVWEYINITNNCVRRDEWKRFDIGKIRNIGIVPIRILLDWLNAHHLDYYGLIEMGLALEAPKDMYVINQ
jgi:hypothetical protein